MATLPLPAPEASKPTPAVTRQDTPDNTRCCCWNGRTVVIIGLIGFATITAIALILLATPVGAGVAGTALLAVCCVGGLGIGVTALLLMRCKNPNQEGESEALNKEKLAAPQQKVGPRFNLLYNYNCRQAREALPSAITGIYKCMQGINLNPFDTNPNDDIFPDEMRDEMRTSILENPSKASLNGFPAKPGFAYILADFIKSLFAGETLPGTDEKFPLLYFFDPHAKAPANEFWWHEMTQECDDDPNEQDTTRIIGEIVGKINGEYFDELMMFINFLNNIANNSANKEATRKQLALNVLNPILHHLYLTKLDSSDRANTCLAEFIILNAPAFAQTRPPHAENLNNEGPSALHS